MLLKCELATHWGRQTQQHLTATPVKIMSWQQHKGGMKKKKSLATAVREASQSWWMINFIAKQGNRANHHHLNVKSLAKLENAQLGYWLTIVDFWWDCSHISLGSLFLYFHCYFMSLCCRETYTWLYNQTQPKFYGKNCRLFFFTICLSCHISPWLWWC